MQNKSRMKSGRISAPEWRSWLRLSITNLSFPSSEHAIDHSAFLSFCFVISPFARPSSVDNCMRIHKVIKCMSYLCLGIVPAPWFSPIEPQTFELQGNPEKSQRKAKAIPFFINSISVMNIYYQFFFDRAVCVLSTASYPPRGFAFVKYICSALALPCVHKFHKLATIFLPSSNVYWKIDRQQEDWRQRHGRLKLSLH